MKPTPRDPLAVTPAGQLLTQAIIAALRAKAAALAAKKAA